MDFKVDREKWRTGKFSLNQTGEGITYLLNAEGYMCCLGFCMLQEGFTEEEVWGRENPSNVQRTGKCSIFHRDEKIEYFENNLTSSAIRINDNIHTTREEKEEKLRELFQAYGHTITFYDGSKETCTSK